MKENAFLDLVTYIMFCPYRGQKMTGKAVDLTLGCLILILSLDFPSVLNGHLQNIGCQENYGPTKWNHARLCG